jgi:hypothetical protein
MWETGELLADLRDGLSGLPLERMIGEEVVRGKGDFRAGEGARLVEGDKGDRREEDGNGTEPSPGKA